MKNENLYHKTVDILVQAYFNDTLIHDNCYACAVGNIVAGNNGYCYEPYGRDSLHWVNEDVFWQKVFISDGRQQNIYPEEYTDEAKQQIDSTGYSWENLAKIEKSFEGASKIGDYMFNGLMAVIDVLDVIHENTDVTATQVTKKRFVKA